MLAVGIIAVLAVLPAYAADLIRQLQKARQRAEEASAAKSRFLARMGHELRTPLTGILGTTDILLNNQRLSSEDRGLLGVIQESVSVSLRQINNVLDFSKLEAGKLIIDQADFSLQELLNGTVRMVSTAARDKNLPLLVRISPDVPFHLIGDAHHLREIILSLLSNAVKFTETGYVVVEVALAKIEGDEALLRFEIRDTGIGIAPESLERIWESFSREASDTSHSGGAGLGTTIAKQLVELMGGHIDVASLKGRGTAFWFTLPFRLQPDHIAQPSTLPGAKVLAVVADVKVSLEIQASMGDIGGNVVFVPTVSEAVTAFSRGVRLGNLWHTVLIDERIGITAENVHRAGALTDKTTTMQTPVYLLASRQYDSEQLYAWGYTATLPFNPSARELIHIIHASPHYNEPTSPPSGVVRVEPWAWGRGAKARPRILIADDNKTNRLILGQILESAGYDVDSVDDGEMALDRLLSGGYKAAVLDMHMPGLDGVELLRQYRLVHPGVTVPVIMLTADATFNAKRDSADAGADAFLTKPAKSEVLLATLERLIHDSEVRVLSSGHSRADSEKEQDVPILDLSVLAELDRLCRDPKKLAHVIDTFESEGVALLGRIAGAIGARDHAGYVEWVHALKGNAANVGAVQLVAACRRAETIDNAVFRREGAAALHEMHEFFDTGRLALRELVQPTSTPGQGGPG
jgi:two-component system sensor histidine kinase RpfC